MPSTAIVDAGPLYSAIDADDADHPRCRAVLERGDLRLIIACLVVAEVRYLVGSRLRPTQEMTFLRALSDFEVEAPLPEEWLRIADLVVQYADFPLGGTDASVISLAERVGTDLVITLDRRHFGAVRPLHVPSLRLLPD